MEASLRPAIATRLSNKKYFAGVGRSRRFAASTGLYLLAMACGLQAKADSLGATYHGQDLGLTLREAIAQVQATGGSQASHLALSVSGSGDQLMFTEVNYDTIESETASYKDLEFSDVDVRKIGEAEGRYGVTLRAAAGSVNDHIVGIAAKSAASARDSALGYMDFWLVDPDMKRIRHLADLLATIGARLKQQQSPDRSARVLSEGTPEPQRAIAEHLEEGSDEIAGMPVVLPAPRIPVASAATLDDSDAAGPASPPGKCLFPVGTKLKHAKSHAVAASWSAMKQTPESGNGRLSYRISALHDAADRQSIQFYLGNTLPVAATVVARVILTSSDGTQQAEDIGLNQLGGRSTKTDESLLITPFEDAACITDVDVTEVHACPLADDQEERDDSDDIFRCNADAAAGTVTRDGITYIRGREPKSLVPPAQMTAAILSTKARN